MKRDLVIIIAAVLGLSACGGGSSTSSSASSTSSTGFAIPTEISAVPTDNSSAAASLTRGLAAHMHALSRAVSDVPADSDYKKTTPRKYVEEHSLEQFSIIETIMKALVQTNYADAANIGAGPYKAMIAWEDNQGGTAMKTLEPWVVDSQMITVNGQTVNRVQAWIEDSSGDSTKLIRADFDIYQSATQNADGSYADYGKWSLTAKFNDTGSQFFSATADIVNGQTVLKINSHQEHGNGAEDIQAVMYRAGADGYGKVNYPEQNCDNNGCTTTTKTASYAYNDDYVAVDDGSGGGVVYKDRNAKTELTQRYGLFYAAAGTDANGKAIAAGDSLMKHKSFGFPVSYTATVNGASVTQHAYYGAWGGRHSLWASGGRVPAGTTVTREDHGANTTAETYTVSASLSGTLTKRTLVAAALSDIQNIPFETFVNKNMNLQWDGSNWMGCAGFMDWSTNPPTCKDMNGNILATSAFTDFGFLVLQANDRKNVNINRWDQNLHGPNNGGSVDYVYLDATNSTGVTGYSGPGFYPANRNQNNGQLTVITPAVLYTPAMNDMINVNIGGSIYIQYTGNFTGHTGWVQKTLESFDQQTWTPKFAVDGDTDFTPELGKEYYIHSNGANFVVDRVAQTNPTSAASDYTVMIELQTTANPSTVATILPAEMSYLVNPWNKDVHYTLDTTSSDPNFMMLVYATEDQAAPGTQLGTVLSTGQWGLQAYSDNGTPNDSTDDVLLAADGSAVTVDAHGIPIGTRPVQFNWEFADPNSGNNWGSQQFLVKANGDYMLLSDPVSLNPIAVTDGSGASKTLSLQFDGWMHGLPDMYNELSKNDWVMTTDIANKVINIPEDTLVTDSNGTQYYIKPLEVSEFLTVVTVAANGKTLPDTGLTTAIALDLATVGLPTYVEYSMGDTPTNLDGSPLDPKYSEGNPVD